MQGEFSQDADVVGPGGAAAPGWVRRALRGPILYKNNLKLLLFVKYLLESLLTSPLRVSLGFVDILNSFLVLEHLFHPRCYMDERLTINLAFKEVPN